MKMPDIAWTADQLVRKITHLQQTDPSATGGLMRMTVDRALTWLTDNAQPDPRLYDSKGNLRDNLWNPDGTLNPQRLPTPNPAHDEWLDLYTAVLPYLVPA